VDDEREQEMMELMRECTERLRQAEVEITGRWKKHKVKLYNRRWQAKNLGRYRHSQRDAQKRYRERNPEKIKERQRGRVANPDPEARAKRLARAALNNAIVSGKIERPKCCSRCGGAQPHGHHHDYAKPLEVEWLCAACHGEEHRVG
jgi:hypothetical protein